VKDVAQMGLALIAHDLHPLHAMAGIGHFADSLAIDRFPETRPAGAGIELGLGIEQRCAAADATIGPVFMAIPIVTAERRFRSLATRHVELLGRKPFSPLLVAHRQFVVGLEDFTLLGPAHAFATRSA